MKIAARSEHEELVALLDGASLMSNQWPELSLLFAVPNAGKRTPATANWLRAEGMKAGVPDLVLPVARGGCPRIQDALKQMMKKVSASARVASHNIDSVAELGYVSMERKIHLRKGKYRRYSEEMEQRIIESENKPE